MSACGMSRVDVDVSVSSLVSSLKQLPPSAIPAMIECVLATTGMPPSDLYARLLISSTVVQNAERESSELDSGEIITETVALCHLLSKLGHATDALIAFVWKCIIPLTKSSNINTCEIVELVLEPFLGIVQKTNSWDIIGATLVPFLLKVVGESVSLDGKKNADTHEWDEGINFLGLDCLQKNDSSDIDQSTLFSGKFPLPNICRLLTLIFTSSVYYVREVSTLRYDDSNLKILSGNLLWALCNLSERFLLKGIEHRHCAITILIPNIFKEVASNPLSEVSFCAHTQKQFRKIWKVCKILFGSGSLERKDAFSALSLCLFFSVGKNCEAGEANESTYQSELLSDPVFWEEIKAGLIDGERQIRKQSLHVLKSALQITKESHGNANKLPRRNSESRGMAKRELWAEKEANSLGVGNFFLTDDFPLSNKRQWEAFLLLYEMLDEYGTHLVEAAWNHQINFLLKCIGNPDNFVAAIGEKTDNLRKNSKELFSWLAILWKLGFFHENPQVRCLIMQSFLAIDWEEHADFVTAVPLQFILGPLVDALNDPVHHTDFGIKGVYTSITIDAACKFFRHFSNFLTERYRLVFIRDLAAICRHGSLCRAGLMCLAECVASAACMTNNDNEVATPEMTVNEFGLYQSIKTEMKELLDSLRCIIENCKQHFNPNYRLRVFEKVLDTVGSMVTLHNVTEEAVILFVSAFPREHTKLGGTLRKRVQEWLLGSNDKRDEAIMNNNHTFVRRIQEFPERFTSPSECFDDSEFNDEDVDAWECEARRWARLLLLVVNVDHFSPITSFIMEYRANPQIRLTNLPHLKFNIFLISLVMEVEITLQRACEPSFTLKSHFRKISSSALSSLEYREMSILGEKLLQACLHILDELLPYAIKCSPIFWTSVVDDSSLPSSVRGKLGGPSQRRLSTSTTADVLHAITSMRTITSILTLCTVLKVQAQLDSAWTFLWGFFWKIVSSPTYVTETGAEISLSAYEVLVPILRAQAFAFSPVALDVMRECHKQSSIAIENKYVIDQVLLSFIEHINKIANSGALSQGRRAVLLQCKWLCLESLLSILCCIVENEIHQDVYKSLSGPFITFIFSDICESLDIAGDMSILPMLRSLRIVLDLLKSGESFLGGVDLQMIWNLVRSAWVLYANSNKRRVASLAILLSSVLHASIFADEKMHCSSNDPGPLKWFVECFLREGTKSPRSIRLAALHLTGLLFQYPHIIKFYIKELKLLTLYGTVAFDEDFEGELADNHDASVEVSLLAHSPEPELANEFINTELFPRVCVALLFHKLGKLCQSLQSSNGKESCCASICGGKSFLLELLDSAVNDKDLAKELYKKYSGIHRRKIRVWQMICVMSSFVTDDIVCEVTNSLHVSLKRNNMPGVRQYLEIFAISIYLKFPHLVREQVVPIIEDYDMRPQALSSYVFIAANVIMHANETTRLTHLDDLLPPIIPLLTSHHHSLRGFTQLLVHHVLVKYFPTLDSDGSTIERRALGGLRTYLSRNPDCARLRRSMEGYLDNFNPFVSSTPSGIFVNRVEELQFECVPVSLMEEVNKFLNEARDDLRSSMANDLTAIKDESLKFTHDFEGTSNEELNSNLTLDFQKKLTLYKHEIPYFEISGYRNNESFQQILAMEKEDLLLDGIFQSRQLAKEKLRASRQQIILVASLLDRIPNLAGLARTCEIFKASGLVVADKSILRDKQFQLISVTAEKWVPVIEIPVRSLKLFLEKKKSEGFSILGLEQTANSVPLDHYAFPNNSIIVLGREKEGIPVDIIHVLDTCLEIPQLGVVRSLNVHVSGAIALWEYTRQRRAR